MKWPKKLGICPECEEGDTENHLHAHNLSDENQVIEVVPASLLDQALEERDEARTEYKNLLRAGEDQTTAFEKSRAQAQRYKEALERAEEQLARTEQGTTGMVAVVRARKTIRTALNPEGE